MRIWNRLEAGERDRRLKLTGRFLAAGPWRSKEARAEYEHRTAGPGHLTLEGHEVVYRVHVEYRIYLSDSEIDAAEEVGTKLAPLTTQKGFNSAQQEPKAEGLKPLSGVGLRHFLENH